jgi:hypothetical protein
MIGARSLKGLAAAAADHGNYDDPNNEARSNAGSEGSPAGVRDFFHFF